MISHRIGCLPVVRDDGVMIGARHRRRSAGAPPTRRALRPARRVDLRVRDRRRGSGARRGPPSRRSRRARRRAPRARAATPASSRLTGIVIQRKLIAAPSRPAGAPRCPVTTSDERLIAIAAGSGSQPAERGERDRDGVVEHRERRGSRARAAASRAPARRRRRSRRRAARARPRRRRGPRRRRRAPSRGRRRPRRARRRR